MSSSVSRKCKSICNWSYSFKHFKWPSISRWQLGTTFKFQGTLPCFHSEVNMIPNTGLSILPMLIYIAFLSVLCCFQILPDLYNLLLHFLEQFWSKHNPIYWIVPSHWCPTPSSIQRFIRTHPQGFLMSITWLVCPSHRCEAYLQALD